MTAISEKAYSSLPKPQLIVQVAEIVTVLVSMVEEVELMSCVLVMTDVVFTVLVMVIISVSDSTSGLYSTLDNSSRVDELCACED